MVQGSEKALPEPEVPGRAFEKEIPNTLNENLIWA